MTCFKKLAVTVPLLTALIEFERERAPKSTRRKWIESASQRWERDNRNPKS